MSSIFALASQVNCTGFEDPVAIDACTSIQQMFDISLSAQQVYDYSHSILSQSLLWALYLTVSTSTAWGHTFKKSGDVGGPFFQLIWLGLSVGVASNVYYKIVGDRIDVESYKRSKINLAVKEQHI